MSNSAVPLITKHRNGWLLPGLVIFCCSLVTLTIESKPIFTVAGSLKDSQGRLITDRLPVEIVNQSRDIQIQTQTQLGSQEAGKFAATWSNFDGKSVVELGDQLHITIYTPSQQTLIEQQLQVSATQLKNGRVIISLQLAPAQIDQVSLTLADGTIPVAVRAETPIKFMLKGSSGQLASVSVAGLNTLSNLNLQESPAGTYQAEYTTQAGDNIDKATVTFLLADQSDNSLQLTIDTTPPPAPTQLQLVGDEIGVGNLKQVQISAQTLPLAEVIFTLTDQRDHSQFTQAKADISGEATASLDASILLDGPIQITAQLAPDLAGNSGLPAQIQVQKETPTATFLLEIAEAKTRVRVGEDARYTVLLYSQNGFLQPVKLSVDQSTLPAGVTASFQPSEIIFTQPTQKATLTLASGNQAVTGIHQLSVTAQGGEVLQTANLQLELEKLTAFITLNLSTPSPIQYRKPIRLFGQVILPDEASSADEADLPIQLTLTRPDQNQQVLDTSTLTSRTYAFDQVSFDQIGLWTVQVQWAGDSKYNQVEESQQVKVVPAQPILQWMTSPKSVNPQVAPLGQTINLALQLVEPQVKDLSLLLTISRPDQNANQKIRLQTDALGVISTPIQLEADGDWGFIVDWEGNSNYQPISSTEHRLTVTRELGKAIVVLGGGDESNNPSWTRFNTTASHVYQTLLKRRLTEEDIFYLSPASDPDPAVDEQVSEFQLERAITQWAKNQVSSAVPLWIYLLSHNTGTHFLLHESATGQNLLSAEKLAGWISCRPRFQSLW